jgi:hypothetical protein
MIYIKIIIYIHILSLMCSCGNSKTISKNTEVTTKEGIIIFSKLKMDYFFPFKDTLGSVQSNYYDKEFGKGFLLTNVSPSFKIQLKNNYSDTLSNSFNYPATNVLPVRIEYFESTDPVDTSKNNLCIIFNNKRKTCFTLDINQRFIKRIIPLLIKNN